MKSKDIRKKLEHMLSQGKVMVFINSNVRGVKLPENLLSGVVVPVIMSDYYPGIDLEWNQRSVSATLRFGGEPFRCKIPYSSIEHMEMREMINQAPAQKQKPTRSKTIGEQVKSGSLKFPRTGLGRRGTLTQLK